MSQGNDSFVPRYFFSLLREAPLFSTLRSTSTDHYPQCPWIEKKKKMQGCSFKLARQEPPESTQKQSCSQDGRQREPEKTGANWAPSAMWKMMNLPPLVFFLSATLKSNFSVMLECRVSVCWSQDQRKGVLLLGEERFSHFLLAARKRKMAQWETSP